MLRPGFLLVCTVVPVTVVTSSCEGTACVQVSADSIVDTVEEVSLLQTGVKVDRITASRHVQKEPEQVSKKAMLLPQLDATNRRVQKEPSLPEQAARKRSWAEAAASVLMTSPADAIASVTGLKASKQSGAKGSGFVWLDHVLEKLTAKAWETREWLYFIVCLLLLEAVVWRATLAKKTKDLMPRLQCKKSHAKPQLPAPVGKFSLTLPLRELLSQGPVKLLNQTHGLALVATLLEDAASGNRTVQIAEAAEPLRAVMSVGPIAPDGSLDDFCAAVHRYNTGYTVGALRSDGAGSWSLDKNGRSGLKVTSPAPFTLSMSCRGVQGPGLAEVAWVKPLSAAKAPDFVDFSICDGGDPVLPVACALALLVASSSRS